MFLFRSFYRQPGNNESKDGNNTNVQPASANYTNNQSSSSITDPSSAKTVITVDDNIEEEGFANVDVRPFTYAEVASLSIPPEAEVRRIHVPNGWNDDDEHDDEEIDEGSGSLYNSTYSDGGADSAMFDSISSYLRSPRKSGSITNADVLGELQYGERVRSLKLAGYTPPFKYFTKNRSRGEGKVGKQSFLLTKQ